MLKTQICVTRPQCVKIEYRLRWPRGLRRGCAAVRFLGLRVRIPPGEWMSVSVNIVCLVEVSAAGRSLVQRSLTEFSVCECGREISTMSRHRPSRGFRVIKN